MVTATVCGLSKWCVVTQTRVWRGCDLVCRKQRARGQRCRTHTCVFQKHDVRGHSSRLWCLPVVSHDARMCVANACAAIGPGVGHMSSRARTCAWPSREPVNVCTHICVLQKQATRGHASGCLIAPSTFVIFECVCVCVTSQMCVADACTHVYCGKGCCCDLAACRFFACKHTYTHAHARTFVAQAENPGVVSDCAHTHVCVAEAWNPWSHFQLPGLCSDCAWVQPLVCCRCTGLLRPRCRKRCLCDVRTCVVAQRCVSGSRNPWSRLRAGCGLRVTRHVCGRSIKSLVSDVTHAPLFLEARSPGARFRFVVFISGVS